MKYTQQLTGNWSVIKKVLWQLLLTPPFLFLIGNVVGSLLLSIDKVILVYLSYLQSIWLLPVAGIVTCFIIPVFRKAGSSNIFQNIRSPNNGLTEKFSHSKSVSKFECYENTY